jgi:electron transfer flavoprotein alpha subunit
MLEQAHEEQQGPSIEDADIVVAGGRGLGGPENFALVEELASALGGAVAATRGRRRRLVPVLDPGRARRARRRAEALRCLRDLRGDPAQGRHAGLERDRAINKDGNAPIFEFSDFGVVGDLHQVVPKLTELVRARRAG